MNERQLADRIGNLSDRAVDDAADPPQRKRIWMRLVYDAADPPRRKGIWTRLVAVAAALAVIVGLAVYLTGRTPAVRADDLMAGYRAKISADPSALTEEGSAAVAELGLDILRACGTGGNDLFSPVSIASALGMTAMGARGETLDEMSAVLGLSPEELARYLRAYRSVLFGDTVHMANSVWFRDDPELYVEPDFLQANADYYSAGAYKSDFSPQTVEDINNWTKAHTGGMIDRLLDRIPDEAVMYIVNALSFEDEWLNPYTRDRQIKDAPFTTEDGEERTVEMMYSDMEKYFCDELSQGFMRLYKNGCAFAAILPDEGVSVDEYLADLTGQRFRELLASADNVDGRTGIPKFKLERDYELSGALSGLGMASAFDRGVADFTGIGHGRNDTNLYISRVIHKTFMEVDEKGARAAAVTGVEVPAGPTAPDDTSPIKNVYLDRPFIFAIVDVRTLTPLFMGVVRDIGK